MLVFNLFQIKEEIMQSYLNPLRFTPVPTSRDDYSHIMIIGRKNTLKSSLSSWAEYAHWEEVINLLGDGKKGDSLQTISLKKRLYLYAPPTEHSRNLSPSRSDAVGDWVKKNLVGEGNVLLIVCPDQEEFIQPWFCAIAKAVPLFSAKSKLKRPTIDVCIANAKDHWLYESQLWAEQVQKAGYYVDLPPEFFNVPQFIDAAREIASKYHCEIDVFEGEQLLHSGFGGLWNVGKCATNAPAIVVLHGPKTNNEKKVWVGKGIMYDTGGLSLKAKTDMGGMKMDMGGAAAVLSAFELACRRQKHTDLCAILCLAENAIGPNALRNDDIITLYSQKTIEINNTDAEGRLVLGDGVAYAVKHLNPKLIIDIATLTGAQLVATGKKHAAILTNDGDLENKAVELGKACGDLVFPILYCPELLVKEFRSEVADMKNSVRDRNNAQSSCAGHFIETQLNDYQGLWLHIDIAGPAWIEERGTGYGVALLNRLLEI